MTLGSETIQHHLKPETILLKLLVLYIALLYNILFKVLKNIMT